MIDILNPYIFVIGLYIFINCINNIDIITEDLII